MQHSQAYPACWQKRVGRAENALAAASQQPQHDGPRVQLEQHLHTVHALWAITASPLYPC